MNYNYANILHKRYTKTYGIYKAKAARMPKINQMLKLSSVSSANNDTVQISIEAKQLAKFSSKAVSPDSFAVKSCAEKANRRLEENLKNAGSEIRSSNGYISPSSLYKGNSIDYTNSSVVFNYYVEDADEKAYNRQMINNQIQNIFNDNGINLDKDIVFSVDPYDYKITVEGADDELKEKIENALNKGENGYNLYTHIYFCAKDGQNSSQLSDEGQIKRYVNDFVKEKIGIDLRSCTKTENDYITADGRSVKGLLFAQVDKDTSIDDKEGFKNLYEKYINQTLAYDYGSGQTQTLKISYSSTGLHDIMQDNSYGTGDTGWIAEMINKNSALNGKNYYFSFLTQYSQDGNSSQAETTVTQVEEEELTETQEENENIPTENNEKANKTPTQPTKSQSGTVTFNQAKRARQLAAAETEADVRAVLNLLYGDLSDCKAGVLQGMCDNSEVAKVQAMITRARSRMGTIAATNKNKNQDEDQLSLSYLNVLM